MGDGMSMVNLPLEIAVGEVAAAGGHATGMFLRNEDVGLIKAWNSKRVSFDSKEAKARFMQDNGKPRTVLLVSSSTPRPAS